MTFNSHLEKLHEQPIENYDPEKGIQSTAHAIRVSIDWDLYEDGVTILDRLSHLLKDKRVREISGLVIGPWDFESSESSAGIVTFLCDHAAELPQLRALFLGDIIFEELECSWIQQSDVSPLFAAFPNLDYFGVRGGTDLSLSHPKHDTLKHLVIQTGGMSSEVLGQIRDGQFPSLVHLELWTGSDNYGFDADTADIDKILELTTMPELRYLGIRNCEIADQVAAALKDAAITAQLDTLDLSMGCFGDEGAAALAANPAISRLKHLNLEHHYMTEKGMALVKGLGISVNCDDPQEEDVDEDDRYRYIAVSE